MQPSHTPDFASLQSDPEREATGCSRKKTALEAGPPTAGLPLPGGGPPSRGPFSSLGPGAQHSLCSQGQSLAFRWQASSAGTPRSWPRVRHRPLLKFTTGPCDPRKGSEGTLLSTGGQHAGRAWSPVPQAFVLHRVSRADLPHPRSRRLLAFVNRRGKCLEERFNQSGKPATAGRRRGGD